MTVTPPTGNLKNSKFFQRSLNILNVYFWGDNVYFGVFSKILGFGEFLFVAGGGGGAGFWDSVGQGAP